MPGVGLSLQRAAYGDVPEGREFFVPLCPLPVPNHHCEQGWLNHSGCGLPPEVEAELCISVCCWLRGLPVLFLLKCLEPLWFPALIPYASTHPSTVGSWY